MVGGLPASAGAQAVDAAPADRAPSGDAPAPADVSEAAAETGGQAEAAPDRFFIKAYDVSGATLLSMREIGRVVYRFAGPGRTQADVQAAQKALQAAYAARGYEAAEVEIPVQPADLFAQGVVQLVVREAPVGAVRVVDARHHSAETARAQVPSLVEGRPVDVAALQRDVAEANRFPDRTIMPRFKAGSVPGTVDVELKVEDQLPYHARVELNNDNSPNTRPLRSIGTLRATNLWGQGHTLSVTGSVAPQATDQSAMVSGSYNAPLIGTPWGFLVYGYVSNSNVAALGGTNVLGNGYQVGARATYRLPATRSFQQISFGPDFKAFKETLSLSGTGLRPTRIRYLPLTAEYTLSGASDAETYGLTLGVTGGLRIIKRRDCFQSPFAIIPDGVPTCALGGGETGIPGDQFTGRAVAANENFVHLNLDFNYLRELPQDFQAVVRFSGQLADSSLVTNEQFSLGGMSNIRGYYVSEAIGDDGLVSSLELRSPNVGPDLGTWADELRLFAFWDGGYARYRAPAIGQIATYRLFAIGGGLRFDMLRYLTGEVLVGVPLRDGPITHSRDPRYSFSIRGEF